jgi:hypothetical protein
MTEKLQQLQPPETDSTSSGIISPCHSKKIPLWLVLLDNVPTIILFILGAAIIYQLTAIGSMIFLFYAVFSVIWFWAKICPYCHHYNTHACPCGYGIISANIFKKQDSKSFKKVFRRNILIVFPNWFVPAAVAIYLLLISYSIKLLILTIAFCVIGFLIIPLISKLVGCKNCEIKDDCPWMSVNKKVKP